MFKCNIDGTVYDTRNEHTIAEVEMEAERYRQLLLADIPDIDTFCKKACNSCGGPEDWYCPTECDVLEKARKMPWEKIQKCYTRHDGDLRKVFRYIKQYKLEV